MTEEELKKYVDEYFLKYMLIPFDKFIENWEETEQWADYYYKKHCKLQARINEAIEYINDEGKSNNSNWLCQGREDLLAILKGDDKE